MSAAPDFTRHVPGFDFLQGLLKSAGAGLPGLPGVGQWIAPTLDPDELDKRIRDLKTVQFWLEQNAKLLATTVQALEVQRMTLATLKSMNLPMADLGEALKARPAPAQAPVPEPEPAPKSAAKPAPQPAAALVDPMQWWGALTQQFTELAARVVKDGAELPGGLPTGAAATARAKTRTAAKAATKASPAAKKKAPPARARRRQP